MIVRKAVALTALACFVFAAAGMAAGQDSSGQETDNRGGKQGSGPAVYTGMKKRIAVLPIASSYSSTGALSGNIPLPAGFGSGLADMLVTELIGTGCFVVVERMRLSEVMREIQLGDSGAVTPKSAPPIGKLTGAQMLVKAAITEFSVKTGSRGVYVPGWGHWGGDWSEATLRLDVQLIDTMTGQIVDAVSAEGRERVAGDITIEYERWSAGGGEFQTGDLGKAVRKAVQDAVKKIVGRMEKVPWESPWEGLVADIDPGGVVYVNAGQNAGLKVGDILEVLQPGARITDPETGTLLGRKPDTVLGRVRIESVSARLSTCKTISGGGFQKEHVVHLAGSESEP